MSSLAVSTVLAASGLGLWALGRANRRRRVTVLVVYLIYLGVWTGYAVIDRLTGAGWNEAFLYHLQQNLTGAGIGDFGGLAVLGTTAMMVGLLLAAVAYRCSVAATRPLHFWPCLMLLFGAIGIHPVTADVYATVSRSQASPEEFARHYVAPEPLPPREAPRNLLFVYAESLERTYLDEERFPGVISELRPWLARGRNYTNIVDTWGTGWTIGGMTASQCGIPLVTTGSGTNSLSEVERFLPGAMCLGDVLSAAGYRLSYYGGAALSFTSKGAFYASHGFDEVVGRRAILERLGPDTPLNTWGVYDDTLLDLVFERFTTLSEAGDPFALVTLTLDTHHPNGHVSPTCLDRFPESTGNPMLDAVRCSDFLIARLLTRVAASGHADRTTIVLASDHLAMPNTASPLLEALERRNLLTVWAPGDAPATVVNPGSKLDVPAILLNALNYPTPSFGLGRDIDVQPSISAANSLGSRSFWGFETALRTFWQLDAGERTIALAPESLRVIAGNNAFGFPVTLSFSADGVLTDVKFPEPGESTLASRTAADRVSVDLCAFVAFEHEHLEAADPGSYCIFISNARAATGQAASVATATLTSATDVQALLAMPQEFGLSPARLDYTGVLMSSGGPGQTAGYFAASIRPIDRGTAIFGLSAPNQPPTLLFHDDTCAAPTGTDYGGQGLRALLDTNRGRYRGFAVVSQDSSVCANRAVDTLLEGTALQGAGLDFRTPYVGVIGADGALIFEQSGPAESSVLFPLRRFWQRLGS